MRGPTRIDEASERSINLGTTDGPAQLEAHVKNRLRRRVHDLRLVARHDGLILRGHTHSCCAKQLAQHAVMEATTVPILANQVEAS